MICKSLTWPVKRVSLRNIVEKRNISQNACQLRRKIIEQCFWNSTALIPQDSITWTVLALNSCSALDTGSRYLPIRLQSVGKYFHYTVPHYSFEGLLLSVSPAQGTCQEKTSCKHIRRTNSMQSHWWYIPWGACKNSLQRTWQQTESSPGEITTC